MFSLANLAVLDLKETSSPQVALEAARLFHRACLHLTEGQYLDISYEDHLTLNIEKYWPMVRGKTAALLATCTEIGALVAQAEDATRQAYRQFGHCLGLAFQVQDDLLGIWGDAALTGKSNQSDLLEGKKSLPVLFGLQQRKDFAARWIEGEIQKDEVYDLAKQLEIEGALDYTQKKADELTQDALNALNQANPRGEGDLALFSLAKRLLNRSK
jgi:geranylgeranyl diphosphate synthase type I